MPDVISYCGTPRSSEEWAALAKVAGGQPDVTRHELKCLFMLGLVERHLGRVYLSRHGRATLGLPDQHAPGAQGHDQRAIGHAT